MKIIKKGKLFGVLNLLDIFIIIFILAMIIPAFHYYIKFNEKGFVEQKTLERYLNQIKRAEIVSSSENMGTIEANVSFKNITKEDLKKIKVGDKEILTDGTVIAEILWLGKPEPDYRLIANLRQGENECRRMMMENGLYSLPAKLRLKGFVHENTFFYKAKATAALERYPFITNSYKVDFICESLPRKYRNNE